MKKYRKFWEPMENHQKGPTEETRPSPVNATRMKLVEHHIVLGAPSTCTIKPDMKTLVETLKRPSSS